MTLSVRLSPEIEERLTAYCRRHGMTKTQVVTRLIERYVAETPSESTPFRLAESLALVGAFEGPEDLATEHRRHIRDKLRAHRPD
jgi:hypothetical protein